MHSGWNPTRRNRNIGTSASGRGRDNRLVIPESWHVRRVFWENLARPRVVTRRVHQRDIAFSVEETRADCVHACTVDDVAHVLGLVPAEDLEGLCHIVLRQPKRKEYILSPVWGRLGYFAKVGRFEGPAIIVEAQDLRRPVRWARSQTPDDARELERLRRDGHTVRETARHYEIESTVESVRATQLYRTLLHEIGHWVDWLESVKRPVASGISWEDEQRLRERYDGKPSAEKEAFAHAYADNLRERLMSSGSIPFERRFSADALWVEGLRVGDFDVEGIGEAAR
jgi:hypothetical protein